MKGGARSKSGPPKDPNSRTSERAGYTLTSLPSEGYAGEVPTLTDFMPDATGRHEVIWAELWSTPQACAWSLERWRWLTVADLVRAMIRAENSESASWATPVRQLREDLGLSATGLRYNGWAIAANELGARRTEKGEESEQPKRDRRLRSADAQ